MSTTAALKITDLQKTFHLGFLGALRPFRRLTDRLQLKGIAYRVDAVKGISFEVERGQVFGFLGPNGAGKTTTIKMLMGLIHPSAGEARILGHSIGDKTARAQIGFLPEHPYFYEHLKPMEFLDFYAQMFAMTARERRAKARALIDRVGLSHAINRPLRKFSKGMIQRIGLAQALINDPELVVLDEPMSGLDPMGRKDVRDIIFELREKGKTVFLSSHILQDVEMICDRVSILVHGELRSEARLAELMDEHRQGVSVSVNGLKAHQIEGLAGHYQTLRVVADTCVFGLDDADMVNDFLTSAMAAGGSIQDVTPARKSLEELFVEETTRGQGT
ncbi:MAG: ABC transporter ATP-binding protein [Myxococcota bacterium]|nr:ABC transporter ATP-binding protein [Myxococcota bacterium]